MISQEVVSPLKVSHSFVKDWIFCYKDNTGIIAHEGNTLEGHSKIFHGLHYPKNLGAVGSSSYILGLSDGLCNIRLFLRRPTNKRRSKKMISTRSALSVNPITHKISIRKTNKIKRRRSKISNPKLRSAFEVPENSLNYHLK
jgi:hypothetical protein